MIYLFFTSITSEGGFLNVIIYLLFFYFSSEPFPNLKYYPLVFGSLLKNDTLYSVPAPFFYLLLYSTISHRVGYKLYLFCAIFIHFIPYIEGVYFGTF